jgi:hypothetical protein
MAGDGVSRQMALLRCAVPQHQALPCTGPSGGPTDTWAHGASRESRAAIQAAQETAKVAAAASREYVRWRHQDHLRAIAHHADIARQAAEIESTALAEAGCEAWRSTEQEHLGICMEGMRIPVPLCRALAQPAAVKRRREYHQAKPRIHHRGYRPSGGRAGGMAVPAAGPGGLRGRVRGRDPGEDPREARPLTLKPQFVTLPLPGQKPTARSSRAKKLRDHAGPGRAGRIRGRPARTWPSAVA